MADLVLNPCTGCVAQAAYTKLLISDSSTDFTATGGASRLHFLGENLKKFVRKRDDMGITGDRWRLRSRIHEAQSFVYGTIYFAMNAGEMQILAPWLLGAYDAGSGDFEPDSCPSEKHLLILRDYGIFKYTGVRVNGFAVDSRALRFREESLADMVVLAVNVIGEDLTFATDESDWPVADEPALGSTAAFNPYFFKDSTLTMNASTDFSAYCKQVKLVVNQNLDVRYRMSVAPTQVCPGDRTVDLIAGLDWNSTTRDLFQQSSVQAGSVQFSNGATCSTQFNFSALVALDECPVSPNKRSDVEWSVRNICAAEDPSADEFDLTITNDATV